MKEMYNNYKKELSKKNSLIIIVMVIFLIGIIFGSIYITILSNDQKSIIVKQVGEYFKNMPKVTFEDKLEIFKNSLISNLLYTTSIWILGLSIVGLPIIFIMLFFKSFILGFSVSSIFAKYDIKGLLKAIIYVLPANLITIILTIVLASYSILISCKLFSCAFKKQTINFKTFMGKYLFLLVISILICILCSLYEAFINPFFYKIIY